MKLVTLESDKSIFVNKKGKIIQIAPWLITCNHTPKTDDELWNKPQDCWCDLHQEACCRGCFKEYHKNCEGVASNAITKKINALRKEKEPKDYQPKILKNY